MFSDEELNKKFRLILPHLNEHAARLYLGSEAQILGRGGKQRVAGYSTQSEPPVLRQSEPVILRKVSHPCTGRLSV